MPERVPRQHLKFQKMADKDGQLVPSFMKYATLGHKEWFHLPIQPTAPTNAFSAAPKNIHYDLEPYDCQHIESLMVRLKISASGGDVQLVGSPYLFDEVEIRSDKGSGKILARIIPEEVVAWSMLTLNEESQDECARLGNYALPNIKSSNQRKYWYNETNYIRNGESKYIYYSLPLNFISLHGLDMSHVKNPIRFTFSTSSDVCISGSANNLSLDGIDYFVSSHHEAPDDEEQRKRIARSAHHAYNFLSADRLQINDKTLTSGQKTEIYLDNFTGKSPFLMIVIKGSTSPQASNGTLFDYYEIGKNGTITLENTSGKDLLANGNPLNQQQLYTHLQEQLGRKTYKGVYILPFTEDIRKSVAGAINGFFQFNGSRLKLCITPDSAPTQEIHAISLGTTASAGTYRYNFEKISGVSDAEIDYNDSTSDILTSINNMQCLKDINISASAVSNNLASTTTQNITFDARSGRVSDELGKITIVGNGIPKINSTSISTYGDDGWTTSSNVEINVFCFKFHKFIVGKDGSLDVEEL